jgi:aspartate racemase
MKKSKSMKTVGIIGGLGPDTTASFYLDIINGCKQSKMINRPRICIANVPIPLDVEQDFILHNKGIDKYLPYLLEQAQILEKAGSDFIVMPCNSLHTFIEELRKQVGIPVLSIVEETVSFLSGKGISRVGIISTSSTSESGIYDTKMVQAGINHVKVSDQQQQAINQIISRLLKGHKSDRDFTTLVNIIDSLSGSGISDLLLACTDLQILDPVHPYIKIHDTMKILADATVEHLLK